MWWIDRHGTERGCLWRAHARDDFRTVPAADPGVAKATFLEHLRKGEAKLLSGVALP